MTGQDHQQQPGRTWKVGALARASGLTVRTLHYYDEIGLLPPSMRLAGGHRLYGADDVARLYRIIRLRQLGFPLSQVAEVLAEPEWQLAPAIERHLAEARHRAAMASQFCTRLAAMASELVQQEHPSPQEHRHRAPGRLSGVMFFSLIDGQLSAAADACFASGYVLDGFPRTVEQAEASYAAVRSFGVEVQAAIHLDVPREELMRRLLARGRGTEDSEAVIERRLQVYLEKTVPLLKYYAGREWMSTVDGARSADAVHQDIVMRIQKLAAFVAVK